MSSDDRRYLYYPLAEALQYHRKLRDITMSSLGRELGLSRHSISRYEKAKQAPSPETLVALARFYGLPDTAFTELLSADPAAMEEAEAISPLEAQQIRWQFESLALHNLRTMPLSGVRQVLDYIGLVSMNCALTGRQDELK